VKLIDIGFSFDFNNGLRWRPRKYHHIFLGVPTLRHKVTGKMANFELADDTIASIAIHVTDASGDILPAPTGDTFSVVVSDATKMTAAIGTMPSGPLVGAAAVILTPLVKLAAGLTVTVSDTAALNMAVLIVDIVADVTPKAIVLDTVDAIFTPQAVPPV
jgi:hypothetical protein